MAFMTSVYGLFVRRGRAKWGLFVRAQHEDVKTAKALGITVEQPTRIELVINLKTAEALGITIPKWLLLRSDEVIR